MKRIVCCLQVLIMALVFFTPLSVQAAEVTESHLIVGKFEYWYDAQKNVFWADFNLNGTTQRINLGMYPFQTYTPWFPAALISDVNNQYKYTVKSVGIAQAEEMDALKYSEDPTDPLLRIKKHSFRNFTLVDPDAIIGQSGTAVNFKAQFQIPAPTWPDIYHTWTANGVEVYRAYIPIKVTFTKTPAVASLTVAGVVDPNPVETDGSGYGAHDLIITATSTISGDDGPQKYILTYQAEGTTEVHSTTIISSNKTVTWTIPNLSINKDTKYILHAEMDTRNQLHLTANGEVTAYISAGVGDFNIDFDAQNLDRPIDILEKDVTAGVPQTARFIFDAEGTTGTNPITGYNFYYRPDGASSWTYSGWRTEPVWNTDVSVDPRWMGSGKKIEVDCRVMVRDNKGFVKYAHDGDDILFNVFLTPGVIALDPPGIFWPMAVTNGGHESLNRVAIDYTHPDAVPWDHADIKLYKLGAGAPVLVDQKTTTNQYYEILGNPNEVFELVVVGYDAKGTATNEARTVAIISDGLPSCTVEITQDENDPDRLNLTHADTTPAEVKAMFPNNWNGWTVWDKTGTVLASGSGELPDHLIKDSTYYGNVIMATQHIRNALGTGTGMDAHIEGSKLWFDLVPDTLYETQYSQCVDRSVGITGKEWAISPHWAFEFTDLVMDQDNRFTHAPGTYDVRLKGTGIFGEETKKVIHSNTFSDLLALPSISTAELAGHTLASGSQRWTGAIEAGQFEVSGFTYAYKREYSYISTYAETRYCIPTVTFKDATPKASLKISGEMKMYRAVTLDGSDSLDATDAALQAAYPIQFFDEKTQFVITPIRDASGTADPARLAGIKGEGRTVNGNSVVFAAKQAQTVRFDMDGMYRVQYRVTNAVRPSAWVSEDINVVYDYEPTALISVAAPTTFRDPKNSLVADMPQVAAVYNSQDDALDLEKSYLRVSYDANNDSNFDNDGQWSDMRIYNNPAKNTLRTQYIQPQWYTMLDSTAVFKFKVDAPNKDILGRFRFDMVVYEAPKTPYMALGGESFDFRGDTFHIALEDKVIEILNNAPAIELKTQKRPVLEFWIYNTTDIAVDKTQLVNQLKTQGVRAIFHIYETDGSVNVVQTFD